MTIKCSICDREIPSHMIDVKHGSHYSEHYESEEHILHPDLGKILEIRVTEELNKKLDEIQLIAEPFIVKRAYLKEYIRISINDINSINNIKDIISKLNNVIRNVENDKVVIKSGVIDDSCITKPTKFGRHYNTHWTRLHIPNIDVCMRCFEIFENKEKISLEYLNNVVPNLNLKKLNDSIWEEIKNCKVKIELE